MAGNAPTTPPNGRGAGRSAAPNRSSFMCQRMKAQSNAISHVCPSGIGPHPCYDSIMHRLISLSVLSLMLGACAPDVTNYPSLARRDGERLAAEPAVSPSPAPSAPIAADPALAARLATLHDQANAAHRQFLAQQSRATTLAHAAAGAAVASESWSVASIALAQLESSRSQAMIALAELDELYARITVDGGAWDAVNTARNQVITLVAAEDRILIDLRSKVAG